MKDVNKLGFDSRLVHAGDIEDDFGSATLPIYQTSTFAFKNAQHGADLFAGKEQGYIYTRIGNPTINGLEEKLAALENGYRGLALASGMAAVNTVYSTFLEQGAHIVCTDAVYGPSRGVLETHYTKFGVEASFVDTANLNDVKNAIKKNTRLVYIETPANPTISLTDIRAVSDLAHANGCVVVVDNTFSSPVLQKPLELGADIVLHSLTKYLNGHADIVGGALIAKEKGHYDALRKTLILMGPNMDPHQAYLVYRGMKTLTLRVQRAQDNAMQVARFLENHPKVAWVKYPGLKSFPQYDLAQKQMSGPGSMISFELKEGFEAGKKLMNNVHLCMLAVSLGGVESLIQHPASMTHASIPREQQEKAHITQGLVRLSVGIETLQDIIDDLSQALEKV